MLLEVRTVVTFGGWEGNYGLEEAQGRILGFWQHGCAQFVKIYHSVHLTCTVLCLFVCFLSKVLLFF